MAKVNKDGWIRHRGGKCPVKAGTRIDARYRDGDVISGEAINNACLASENWTHDGERGDIMAYRLHKEEAEQQMTQNAQDILDAYKKNVEIISAQTAIIASRQADIESAKSKIEDLRKTARTMGFDFYEALTTEPQEDMSDPKNWRAGDVIKLIDPELGDVGELATITEIKGNKIFKKRENGEVTNHTIGSDFWEFHSRPSK